MKVSIDFETRIVHVEVSSIVTAGWLGFEFAKRSSGLAWYLYYWTCGEFPNVIASAPVVELGAGSAAELAARLVGLIRQGPPVVCCCCPCHTRA